MTRRGGGVDEASSPRGDHGANNAWVLHMPAALSSRPWPATTRDWSTAGMCCKRAGLGCFDTAMLAMPSPWQLPGHTHEETLRVRDPVPPRREPQRHAPKRTQTPRATDATSEPTARPARPGLGGPRWSKMAKWRNGLGGWNGNGWVLWRWSGPWRLRLTDEGSVIWAALIRTRRCGQKTSAGQGLSACVFLAVAVKLLSGQCDSAVGLSVLQAAALSLLLFSFVAVTIAGCTATFRLEGRTV